MAWKGKWRGREWLALVGALLLWAGCGGENSVIEPNPTVVPLSGDWTATSMVLTSVANPTISPDLVDLGATFTLNVQPSGQYTAILIYAEQASTEIGILSVSGDVVTMRRSFPTTATTSAVYTLTGNTLTLDGDSEFDFNLDGTAEPATAHFELVR